MMLGLERMDRMRMFADELTAVAAPRISRTLGSAAGSRRRVADAADDDSGSQRSGVSDVSGLRVSRNALVKLSHQLLINRMHVCVQLADESWHSSS